MKGEKFLKGYGTVLQHVSGSDNVAYTLSRLVTYVSDTELNFADASSSNTNLQNIAEVYIIPRKIYGGKF